MKVLRIFGDDEPFLRKVAKDVAQPWDVAWVQDVALSMLETMSANNGVGLAATQVGIDARIIVISPGNDPLTQRVMVNPIILPMPSAEIELEEACLSVPGKRGLVKRSGSILATWYDPMGKLKSEMFTGYAARIIQHEIDHLNGILFTDHVKGELV